MIGAIIGDIIGSTYEDRTNRIKTKDFQIFTDNGNFVKFSGFTDDTVCTVAVAAAISITRMTKTSFDENVRDVIVEFCKKFPHSGYGGRFGKWIESKNHEPYGSTGNGAVMRISPCGWMATSLAEARDLAARTTVISHDSNEAIEWAVAVASANYELLHGATKKDIIDLMPDKSCFSKSFDDVRNECRGGCRCCDSVPEAVAAFVCADSFEDAIRNAVSLGGDADTQASIAGALAETVYEIPAKFKYAMARKLNYLDEERLDFLNYWIKTAIGFDISQYVITTKDVKNG